MCMEFDFKKRESDVGTQYLPVLPVRVNGFPVGNILVDTGATITLIPMKLQPLLGVDVDEGNPLILEAADSKIFYAYPSTSKVQYTLEKPGFRPLTWSGIVFFVDNEDTFLLGHHQCLDQLVLTFDGPRRKLKVDLQK